MCLWRTQLNWGKCCWRWVQWVRCPAAVAQATCLAEGSNQHHHRRRRRRCIYFWGCPWGTQVGCCTQLMGTVEGRDTMAVGVECHGGLGGIGIENTMVTLLVCLDKTGGYVGLVLGST